MLIAIAAAAAVAISVPPLSASGAAPTASSCDVAAQRDEIIRRGTGNPIFMTALAEAPLQAERKMQDEVARLAARAGLSEREAAQMALKIINSPAYVAAREESSRKVDALFEKIDAAARSGDQRVLCMSLVDTAQQLPVLSAVAERQTIIMEQAVAAEARRHGLMDAPDTRQASLR